MSEVTGTNNNGDAVAGTSSGGGCGVRGTTTAPASAGGGSVLGNVGVMGLAGNGTGDGVWGVSSSGLGVKGISEGAGTGVVGSSNSGTGVAGTSVDGSGVTGETQSTANAGISGVNDQWPGIAVNGSSNAGHGVHGVNGKGSAITPKYGCGVWGESANGYGVYGTSASQVGVYGQSANGLAGQFVGAVSVNGTLTAEKTLAVSGDITAGGNITLTGSGDLILPGADCGEEFDVSSAEELEPGNLLVIDDRGALQKCRMEYDRRAAGVVSGAGVFKPGIVLDRRPGVNGRATVALIGKVYCKADADLAPIAVGDLLTSSATPGHAMKAIDRDRAFGAVVGKALQSLTCGKGLIPILVALQ